MFPLGNKGVGIDMACGSFPNVESLQAEIKFLMADKRNLEKVCKELREELAKEQNENSRGIAFLCVEDIKSHMEDEEIKNKWSDDTISDMCGFVAHKAERADPAYYEIVCERLEEECEADLELV